jgi:hypothetical protein
MILKILLTLYIFVGSALSHQPPAVIKNNYEYILLIVILSIFGLILREHFVHGILLTIAGIVFTYTIKQSTQRKEVDVKEPYQRQEFAYDVYDPRSPLGTFGSPLGTFGSQTVEGNFDDIPNSTEESDTMNSLMITSITPEDRASSQVSDDDSVFTLMGSKPTLTQTNIYDPINYNLFYNEISEDQHNIQGIKFNDTINGFDKSVYL